MAAGAGSMLRREGLGATAGRSRVLRVAHVTDIHVQPERRAPEGMAACLAHIQSLDGKPDLILTGGDHVMDAAAQGRDRTRLQWDVWARVLRAENSIPVRSCIGNHDIWGWDKTRSGATGDEPDFGKKWAADALGLPHRYYSFDQAGWHFLTLDGVQPAGPKREGSHSAYLDEEQLDWLKRDLAAVPRGTPILIWSHVPIVSALPLTNPRKPLTGNIAIEEGHVHADAGAIVNLLARHPNVKACLSGHLHQVEHLEIRGVHFHCNGAVCGAWWKGKNRGFPEGYALVDLFDDGSYECRYVPYGWVARSG